MANTEITPFHESRMLRRIADHKLGICKLQMQFQNSPAVFGGTGWLIDSSIVVTAAHCLYRRNGGTFATKVEVFVGVKHAVRQGRYKAGR